MSKMDKGKLQNLIKLSGILIVEKGKLQKSLNLYCYGLKSWKKANSVFANSFIDPVIIDTSCFPLDVHIINKYLTERENSSVC